MSDLAALVGRESVLVCWDVSEDNVARKAGGEAMAVGVRALLGAARRLGVPRIWSQHQFLPPAFESAAWREQYARRRVPPGGEPSPADNPRFLADLGPGPDELVLHKSRGSFFVGTLFRDVLANLGATTIVLCGASTDTGITGTARDALAHGLSPVVVSDAVTANTQEIHERALSQLAAFATVVPGADVVAAWESAAHS